MKKIANQIISFLLLLIIVVSNAGFAIYMHTCKMEGKANCIESSEMSCCISEMKFSETTHSELMDSSCCDTKMQYIKFDFDARYDAFQTQIKPIVLQLKPSIQRLGINLNDHKFAFYFAEPPSPLSGRSILQESQILII